MKVLNTIAGHLNFLRRTKEHSFNSNEEFNSFEEDPVVHPSSEGEEEGTKVAKPKSQIDILVEIVEERIPDIQDILSLTQDGEKRTLQVSDIEIVPLGQHRLHTVELVSNLVQLQSERVQKALVASDVFIRIIELTKAFPWNNMLQLRVINLFERVINGSDS